MEPEEIEQEKPDLHRYYNSMAKHSTDENISKLYDALALQVRLNEHYNERLQELESRLLDDAEDNPKWEYATFFFDRDVFENEDKVLEDLDGYGKEGWEVVSISDSLADYPTAIMKRRLATIYD